MHTSVARGGRRPNACGEGAGVGVDHRRAPSTVRGQLVAAAAAARASRTARPRRARCRRRKKSRGAARWPSAGRSRRRQCATCRAQGREAAEGNRLSRRTQQPAQARFRMARRDARQRRCGHASAHVIVDSAVGLSKKLRALPSCKRICERADAAAEARAVSDAGARRRSRRSRERIGAHRECAFKGWRAHGGGASRLVRLAPQAAHSKS